MEFASQKRNIPTKRKLRVLASSIERERTRINRIAINSSFTDTTLINKMKPLEKMINEYMRK